jgi:flavin-dependent dehydrogenase
MNTTNSNVGQKLGIKLDRQQIDILKTCDAAVVGGSIAGVATALELARAGHKVVLVESHTYLGREITSTLRPWIPLSQPQSQELPEIIQACIQAAGLDMQNHSEEIPLKLDAVKTSLEDLLLKEEVELLYASLPIAVHEKADHNLLIIGNKSGRQAIKCKSIIDATENAAVLKAAGAHFQSPEQKTALYNRTIEFDRVKAVDETIISVPKELGIIDNKVILHQGCRNQENLLAEFSIELDSGENPEHVMKREIEARHRSMKLAAYLIGNVQGFEKATLAATSYELDGPGPLPHRETAPAWAERFSNVRVKEIDKDENHHELTLQDFAGLTGNLWCFQNAADHDSAFNRNPIRSSQLGQAFGKSLVQNWDDLLANSTDSGESSASKIEVPTLNLDVREFQSPQQGKEYQQASVPSSVIPVLRETDVLVVGGGTSGATAATTSAREGANTVLLELNPGLGGTGTLGAVDSYWFGRRIGFNERLKEKLDAFHKTINHKGNKWNIEAKMYVLLKEAEKAGVEVFFNAIVVGSLMEGNRVKGVIVATKWGLFGITAKTVIDATGDGDVAAFSGAEFVYGSSRDNVVMWYSLAQFSRPGLSRNNFTSMVDVSNVEDYTRAILAGRRRKRDKDCHDHGIYVAPRESRHVLAETVLTLTDHLKQTKWADVINIHFSNTDIKGKSQARWLNMGLIPPNLEIEIPYRILLPKKLEGLLIAGKAMSATHDALAPIRMQADLENLGGVIGIAAAMAASEGIQPREVDISKLQARLVKEDLLPENFLKREIEEPREYTEAELQGWIEKLADDKPLYSYSDMDMNEAFHDSIPLVEICTAGPRVIPLLERALEKAKGERQVKIAQALAFYESKAAVPVLIKEIMTQLSDNSLPVRDSHIRYAGEPPDQGAMPDVVYLIYALGLVRDERNIKVWKRVAELLHVEKEDLRDGVKGIFYYVDAVCFGAERLAHSDAAAVLEDIHRHEPLRNQVCKRGFQIDYFEERQAMLELCIARTMARCGSPKGVPILIDYLDDVRSLLAQQAHRELADISGQDFGKDRQPWTTWLENNKGELKPCPVKQTFD